MKIFFCNKETGVIDEIVVTDDSNYEGLHDAARLELHTPLIAADNYPEDRVISIFNVERNCYQPSVKVDGQLSSSNPTQPSPIL